MTRGVSHTPQTLTHYDGDDDDVDDESDHDHHDDDDDADDDEFMKGMNTPEDWHQVPFIFILLSSETLPKSIT